jgi:hypothetical protein
MEMNKYCVIFVFLLLLTGCSNQIVFKPDYLPDGHIGKEYYVPVTISGGAGPVVDLTYDIHPSNSGLKVVFSEKKYHTKYIYNNFVIQGKPKLQGVITININGGIVASAGQDFKKKYKINILK